MRVLRSLLAIVVVLSSMACTDRPSDADGVARVEGVMWILDAVSIGALSAGAPSEARVTLRLEEGDAGGTAGCNQYGGTYELRDGTVAISVDGMTEIGCEEALMKLETAFIDALERVADYRVDGAELVLDGDGVELRFSAERALPLEGTAWHLDGIGAGGDTVSSILAGTEVTATFDPSGHVSGSGGCNRYEATFTVEADRIRIDRLGADETACVPAVSAQEAGYFDALGRAVTFSIEGSTLTLLDAGRAFLISFRSDAAV